jgi:hypothetical protein
LHVRLAPPGRSSWSWASRPAPSAA